MSNMKENSDGFVRADQIDLKSLDEQLEKHLNRVWSSENNTKKDDGGGDGDGDGDGDDHGGDHDDNNDGKLKLADNSTNMATTFTKRERLEWEIDPSKLIIKTVIARGTFGTVHRGIYDDLDVAVKLLDWGEEGHRTDAEIAALRAAFSQEVAVWHKLDHPNVTKFIGATMGSSGLQIQTENGQIGLPNSVCCVVVEYLPGGALKSFLIKNRRRKLAFKVIVHRDVKTENMLLDKTRTVKIADFGVARVEASNPNDMTGETGTLGYMAPEVLNGNPYNRKCDVYSFGICLWEIYCCDMPYPDLSFSEVTSAVVRQNLRPEIPRCCPSSLANVMKRCWDANPDKRPEMDEVVSMLEAIDTSKGGGMIPVDQQQNCFCFRRYRGP
ncbi:serine/threonine-protein kinase HT1-like [Gossypium australe]|uniref:Serine/threonine-protein kinase HT1-like n=1 Tax=Gossypium australe TaxID=47621 RepID=A0A5B6UQI5_9ROSI|nr:serine/threonine-protein kinase HT1-like [Gossypium australe]